jgi:Na+/H+-dicarboxylate symporter
MFKKILKISLPLGILISMLLGIIAGWAFLHFGLNNLAKNWISPFGNIFLNLLKLIAVPIIFTSVTCAIFGIGNIKTFSKLAGKTILLYILTTIMAICLGLLLVNTIKPGFVFSKTEGDKMNIPISDTKVNQNSEFQIETPLILLVNLIPDNIIAATSDNTKMLQIIFIAVMFGIILLILPNEKTDKVKHLLDQLNVIFIFSVGLIMKIAPFGVFALMVNMVIDFGGKTDIFKALGLYGLTVVIGLLSLTYVLYPLLVWLFANIKPVKFIKGIFPAQITAFSTSSSAATLPITMHQVENELKIPKKISGFVLPLGMTINMDGTSLYQTVGIVFIAQVFGLELSFSQFILLVLLTTLSSIGTPGIPGGSAVMSILILSSIGIPTEGLALIMGIDRPLDMLRTVTNISGDSFICCLLKNKAN